VFAFIVLLILLSTFFSQEKKQSEFSKSFLPLWERSSRYTLEVAMAFAPDDFGFKPTREVRSFGEQLEHIAKNLYWLNSTYILEEENPGKDLAPQTTSEIITVLARSIDYVTLSLNKLTNEELDKKVVFKNTELTKRDIFYLMRDHMTHHRGQLIVYLRLRNVLPPEYFGW